DGIRDGHVTGVQTCALPISLCTSVNPAALRDVAIDDATGASVTGLPPSTFSAMSTSTRVVWTPFLNATAVMPTFGSAAIHAGTRSEEHTSELQSRGHLVCRL